MWVLVPLHGEAAGGTAAASAAASQQQQQHHAAGTQFLTAAAGISVGRPLKKGSIVGKADILILGEQSVSTIHAQLATTPATTDAAGAFVHGSLTITDCSKFGTHLTRGAGREPAGETRLQTDETTELHEGDVLRFGSHSRWTVQRLQLLLCASAACTAQHPELQAQATALNAQLVADWALARGPTTSASGSQQQACYCLVAEREQLHPAALRALLQDGWHVATPAWVSEAAGRKACAHSLPPAAAFAPHTLLLPPLDAATQQQQQQPLDVGAWRPPSSSLLSAFRLVFGPGCQADLAAAASSCGAQSVQLEGSADAAALLEQQHAATAAGRAAVLVQALDSSSAARSGCGASQQQQQQHQDVVASVSEALLLTSLVTGDASALAAAVELHAPAAAQRQASAAAAAGSEDAGDADETEEGEEEREEEVLAGAGADAAEAAHPRPAATPATPAAARVAERPEHALEDGAWHQHSHSRSSGRRPAAAGQKRGAADADAAAAAPGDTASPATKRRKTAGQSPAAAARSKAPLPLHQQQAAAAPPAPARAPGQQQGAADSVQAATAGGDTDGSSRAECVTVSLCLTAAELQQQQRQQQQQQSTEEAAVNFKLFRPKQLLWERGLQQAAGSGRKQHKLKQARAAVVAPATIQLVAEDNTLQGPDDEARLRELRANEERRRVAEELFNADLRSRRAPAAATTAAGGRSKKKK